MGKIGRYSLQKELGRGTVATVWLAEDGSDRVAIKQMYSHLADDEIMRERFIREFQTASGLHHPSIVEIYELIEEDGIPALVMEYVEHGNLTQYKPAGHDEIAAIAESLCEAVGYAHRSGIIHRNIRPENILMAGTGRAKLADFGSAHVSDLIGLTTSTMFSKGPDYVAPEILTGITADPRSDLYSVGVVLYELLAGRLPGARSYQSGQGGDTSRPSTHDMDGPRWFQDIVLRLLAPVDRRIQTAEELLESIRSRNGPSPRDDAPCVHCGRETPRSLPVCVHCGEAKVLIQKSDGPDAESLILKSISEKDEVYADFVFVLRCLSGNQTVSPNILTGDIRLYSKEEKKNGVRMPVRIIDHISPRTSDQIIRLFERNGSTKQIRIHKRRTNNLRSREKRGPLIEPAGEAVYSQIEIDAIRRRLADASELDNDVFTDILEQIFVIRMVLLKHNALEQRHGEIEDMLDRISTLANECKRATKFLQSVSLGELYGSATRINRSIEVSDSSKETERLLREKEEIILTFERYREGERQLTGNIALLCTLRSILKKAGTGDVAHIENSMKELDAVLSGRKTRT